VSRQLSRLLVRASGILLAVCVAGCGTSVAPPPPAVTVTPATASVQGGGSGQLSATVASDPTKQGVNWSVACPSIPCGTISPTSTADGAPTTYTAPVALPPSNLAVTIIATSAADSTKSGTAAVTVPAPAGFTGVSEAHIDKVNGMTRLIINGKPVPPLLFKFEGFQTPRDQYLAPQVQDAASHGIHLYWATPQTWPWDNQGTAPLDFSIVDQALDEFLRVDPQALIIFGLNTVPGPGWKPPVPPTNDDYVVSPGVPFFAGYGQISMASDIFFDGFLTSAPHLIQHLQNSSYGAHILGYRVDAPPGDGEWYPAGAIYGPDYGTVNTQKFQAWLLNKYGTDAALSAAWGMPVSIATAQVPSPQPGRFPIHMVIGQTTQPVNAFYDLPQEQDWVDYSAFTSDLFAQRISDAMNMVHQQTSNTRIAGLFNGYFLDIAGSYTGHVRFDKVLATPTVDFICAAISQFDRGVGGAGGVEDPIETTNAHGKFWFIEQDQITYLSLNNTQFPPVTSGGATTADLTQTVDVIERDLAEAIIRRAGYDLFDINSNGAFNDPNMWLPFPDYGEPLFTQIYANPQPYQPEVALVVDLPSILYQKVDIDSVNDQRGLLRIALAKSGVTYGIYTMNDFLDGTLPPKKVYIFANINYATDDEITAIQNRLNNEGATAIWQYAPGYLGPSGADVTRASKLTGIQLSRSDNFGVTNGAGVMAGYTWGISPSNLLSPRLVVTDPNAEILGQYQADGQVSTARQKVGNFESIFSGEFAFSDTGAWRPDALRALLQLTGVHVWSTAGDTVHTDGSLLVVSAAAAGPDTISLPAGVSATPLGGGAAGTGTLNINFSRIGETQWFQLALAAAANAASQAQRSH